MSAIVPPHAGQLERVLRRCIGGLAAAAGLVAPPLLRVALALPFFRSGLTRWDGFLSISGGTLYLFENQFKLHVFGAAIGLPAPDALAFVVAVAEIVLPALLVVGLATRFAALGLLAMTGVIQLVFPDGWANFHLYWASLAVAILALGPGPLSLDRLVDRRTAR
ncbi:DoxX [Burkholderia paludis]|uniref:DoxX family protein n=1 Tax=Burkholderia paludis TaxID=1506587 RepID=UPI0004DB8FDB|nr:DoxX family protein [Burkholderia paludis]KFG97646.1 DoxX [Burkholderia paludis]